jgi:hypothetical protein
MIVRIAGEGQYSVDDAAIDGLNVLDGEIEQALDAGDEQAFRSRLTTLLEEVRSTGTPVAEDDLVPSDLLLPHADATLDEVRDLLGEEGLIPG